MEAIMSDTIFKLNGVLHSVPNDQALPGLYGKEVEILQWGDRILKNPRRMFKESIVTITATDRPILVGDLYGMFESAVIKGDISKWNVSMACMFCRSNRPTKT